MDQTQTEKLMAQRSHRSPIWHFRHRFWLPPRPHGEIIEDRTVSFLELFYDLVYVVVISRAAHTLAGDVSWDGVVDFGIVFGLIWVGWLNGSLYYELHGREDGRTRSFVFLQMLILTVLAVFTDQATGETGLEFGLAYFAFLTVMAWLWYSVRRLDGPEYGATTARYLGLMGVSMVAIASGALASGTVRLVMWGGLVALWVIGVLAFSGRPGEATSLVVTESMVERFGLFVIIVLGEVVVGVVEGLAESDRSGIAVVTGVLALSVGFAFWWTYFDYAGSRGPVREPMPQAVWALTHLPVTMSIAGSGAAMVGLIEHAGDGSTPAATAWLLGGSLSLGLVALVAHLWPLAEARRLPDLYRPVFAGLLMIAAAARRGRMVGSGAVDDGAAARRLAHRDLAVRPRPLVRDRRPSVLRSRRGR